MREKSVTALGRTLSFLLILPAFLWTACSSSKQATAPRKEIKGNWVLTSTSFDGLAPGAKYNIELLDEGAPDCLKGSKWVLPNNGFGSYTIVANQTGCTPGERKINWSYRLENGETLFRYKVLEEGVKAKKVTEGYILKVISADDNSMHLQTQTTAEGKTVYINYYFTSI